MKLSLNWIKRYVDLPADLTMDKLAYDLTMCTVEVEDATNIGESLAGLVVGKILTVDKHPDADKLRVCTVDVGDPEPSVIVCGGINLAPQQLVAVAKPGAWVKWHGEGDPVEIKPAKLRGVMSYGMICASGEIGLADLFPTTQPAEIMDITEFAAAPGTPLADALDLNDVILEIDNTAVREQQIERLRQLRANRNEADVQRALAAITECVRTGKGNLLELAVEAARVRASLGEISDACEAVVGRYKATIRTISGVYSSETKNDSDFQRASQLTEQFAQKEGRRPRIMIAKMGQDGHDRGAKVVATGYADCGFDVDMGPLFQTPAEAAKQAVENDVNVLGVSSLAAGHKTLVPQVIDELKKLGREDIVVIAGGVIPAQDYDFLYKAGVAAIFGPGTSVAKAAVTIMEILLED